MGLHIYSIFYSCQILIKLEFCGHIFEKINTKISNIINVRPLRTKSFHAGTETEGTDMAKLIVAFCNFAKAFFF